MRRKHETTARQTLNLRSDILILLGFIPVMGAAPANDQLPGFLQWIEAAGMWAPAAFILIEVISVMTIMPPMVLTVSAGILFGVVGGTLCVWTGTIIGAILAFLIGRRFGRKRIREYINKYPKLSMVDTEIAKDGWKFVMATRLVPIFPFKVSNYVFGGTGFGLKDFFVGTGLGIVPTTVVNVYAGALAARVATAAMDDTPDGGQGWGVYAIQLALFGAAAAYIMWRAKRMLDKFRAEPPREV